MPVNLNEPVPVEFTLKLPAIACKPPNKFVFAVWPVQFHVKLPKVCERPPVAPVFIVYPNIAQVEFASQVAVGIVPAELVKLWL